VCIIVNLAACWTEEASGIDCRTGEGIFSFP